jgi:hypothetical protein
MIEMMVKLLVSPVNAKIAAAATRSKTMGFLKRERNSRMTTLW